MEIKQHAVVIIGGGPAGLAAACALYKLGVCDILLIEREHRLGGILRQCIHDGFGLTRFEETLSGPEYAARFIAEVGALGIEVLTDATVLSITAEKQVTAATRNGLITVQAQAVILTMGCRERTQGALSIPGERPAGVLTAGMAQSYINLKNTMVGRRVVILGSGDIGMIMARRLTLEGAQVLGVYEILPYPSGLPRNIQQCLEDYDIPLHLSHTVTKTIGRERLSGVEVSRVDDQRNPILGSEQQIECDTLVLSVGLIPENELSLMAGVELDAKTKGAVVDQWYQTLVSGIFAAGNVLHVHDLVDFVSLEAEHLAASVAHYLTDSLPPCTIPVVAGEQLSYVLPQWVDGKSPVTFSFRPQMPLEKGTVQVMQDDRILSQRALQHAIPAEMERIILPAGLLKGQSEVKVVILHD